jgi:hypothetical protein
MANAAEKFRRMAGLVAGRLQLAVLVVVGFVIGISAALFARDWFAHDRHVANVDITVSADRTDCGDDAFPIRVLVENFSSRTLEHVTFRLAARAKGGGSDLAQPRSYEDDRVAEPGTAHARCWAAPELSRDAGDPRALQWSVGHKVLHFRN